jgi:Phosphatidylinositol 3- and 4-kinase
VSRKQRSPTDRLTGSPSDPTALLERGAVELVGYIPYASNYTLLAQVTLGEEQTLAIYKPNRGERPLWDFPPGTLAAREVAAYLVSEAVRWSIVPFTVLRADGPLGPGSLQQFVEHDPDRHFFTIEDEYVDELKVFAAFDMIVNNADRKGGHVLEDADRKLWAIDHGVTFHVDPKLRTVIWNYAEQEVPAPILSAVSVLKERMDSGLHAELAQLLSPREADATEARIGSLLDSPRFPSPNDLERPLPWPLI